MRSKAVHITAVVTFATCCSCEPLHVSGRLVLLAKDDPEHRRLTVSGARLLADAVSSVPSETHTGHPALEPTAKATLSGVTYTVEKDEVLLMDKSGTKVWRVPGILEKLVDSSR